MEGEVIRIGAEAVVSKLEWNGLKLISKHRVPKPYRRPELDRRVREQRTVHEAKVITALKKAGVPCPAIILLDRGEATIYMQLIEGVELRRALKRMRVREVEEVARELGRIVARMHLGGVAHGDLTTSNVILDQERRIFLVDFGLSAFTREHEELAVDIHLLDRSLQSAHHRVREPFMRSFLQGYVEVGGKEFTRRLILKVKEIRMRGRYVEERKK